MKDEKPVLVTADQGDLTLEVQALKVAAQSDPRAKRAWAAYEAALSSGASMRDCLVTARAALHA